MLPKLGFQSSSYLKIIILGSEGVGKSTLIDKYLYKGYRPIFSDVDGKLIEYWSFGVVQRDDPSIVEKQIKTGNAFVVMYTKEETSLKIARALVHHIAAVKRGKVPIVLVQNKIDLKLEGDDLKLFAEANDCSHFEMTALDGQHGKACLELLIRDAHFCKTERRSRRHCTIM